MCSGWRHATQIDRVRQEHTERILLPARETDWIREYDCQSAPTEETLRVRWRANTETLQERLLQRRRRDRIRLQGETPYHAFYCS